MYIGNKDLDKSKQIAKLQVINEVINAASRLDDEYNGVKNDDRRSEGLAE